MNLGELKNQFYVDADDKAEPHLTDEDDLTSYLNEGEEEACRRADLLFERDDTDLCELEVTQGNRRVSFDSSITAIVFARLRDSGGSYYPLAIVDRDELDRVKPSWREITDRPTAICLHDTHIQTDYEPDAVYTIVIECYRIPAEPMAEDADEPEIGAQHHRDLIQWALYRHFSKPDAEYYDPGKAGVALARFESQFGRRPSANDRKRQYSNRPHHIKAYW
jgi:hypothetical protein